MIQYNFSLPLCMCYLCVCVCVCVRACVERGRGDPRCHTTLRKNRKQTCLFKKSSSTVYLSQLELVCFFGVLVQDLCRWVDSAAEQRRDDASKSKLKKMILLCDGDGVCVFFCLLLLVVGVLVVVVCWWLLVLTNSISLLSIYLPKKSVSLAGFCIFEKDTRWDPRMRKN